LSDSFKSVIARREATKQSEILKERFIEEFILSVKTRFFVEPVLSETKRFLASLGMTVSEGLRMTSEGLRIKVFKGLHIKIA